MGFWQFATGGGSGGGTGDVVGPASSTDNAIARFDGATGKLIQNSGVTVADGLTGGVIVGSTGATDNAILRADGTGGATVQASAVSIADTTGMITVPAAGGLEIASSNQAIVGGTSVLGTDVVKIKANQGGSSLQVQNVEVTGYSGVEYLNNSGAVRVFSGFSNSSPHFRFNVLQGDLRFMMSGNSHLSVNDTPTVRLSATAPLVWSATTNDSTASADTGLARSAAGVVKVTDGSTGYGSLDVRGGTTEASIRFGGTTTSFPALGTHASVNTSGLHVYDAAISGWSSIDALAFFPHNGGTASVKFWNSTPSKAQISATDGLLITDFGGGSMAPIFAIYKVEANTAGSGSPNVLTAGESMTVLTNEGVTAKNYHTLPSAVAGYRFTFIVQDADGMRIVANTDDTIRVIDKVTAAAGYIESTTIGSTVTLVSVNAVEWYATSIHGVWTDGTFTYDDTSLTTP